jgi:hypothetical protein
MTRERPIIFSGDMVRAIIDGRKTMTRRVMKPQPDDDGIVEMGQIGNTRGIAYIRGSRGGHSLRVPCPYGSIGDHLYVRENGWERPSRTPRMMREGADTWERFYYDADDLSDGDRDDFKAWGFKRRPSIHMPRWASRITLEITDVHVERLQEISAKDILAEGAVERAHDDKFGHSPVSAFDGKVYLDLMSLWASGWDSINGRRGFGFDTNPYVWCISFRRLP